MRSLRIEGRGGAVLLVAAVLALSGCDYWPPALQAQIEQLKGDLQIAAAERAKLETQLKEMGQMRDQLQVRADELTRLNRELAARVQTLETNLKTEQDKSAKLTKGVKTAPAKTSAKTSTKSTAKSTGKKKPTSKPKTKSKPKGT
jgi:septal ring factor EnvC (AmiA/AmiB activator)